MTGDEFTDAVVVILAELRNNQVTLFAALERISRLADAYADAAVRRAILDTAAYTPTTQAMRRILQRAAAPVDRKTHR